MKTKRAKPGAGRTAAGRQPPERELAAWAPPVVYAAVTVLLFPEFFFGDALLFGTDTYHLSYFAREYYTESVRSLGSFPLWQPLLFGGLPFLDGMHGDIFYPPSLALFFLDARAMWGWKIVLHVVAAGLFAYLWLRGLGLRRASAFFGGLVFMMGADLVSLVYPGGDGKLFVSALAPLTFWLTDRAVRNGRIADYAALALGLATVIFTSHMQLAYFTVWGVSLYFLFRVWQAWRTERDGIQAARSVGLFAGAGIMAVAAAAIQFLPPLEYLREWSHRAGRTIAAEAGSGYEFSTTYSLHPEEVASLVVPEFVGDDIARLTRTERTYWGRNPFKINHEYAGFVPLLLIPLLLIRRRSTETYFFLALAALALLYAVGATTPLFRLFYLIPGVALFRAPSLIIFLYGLSIATLGAFGFERLHRWVTGSEDERRAARRTLWIAAAVFGVLALLASAGIVTTLWQAIFEVQAARLAPLQANLPNIQRGFWITFLLAAGAAGATDLVSRGLFGVRMLLIAVAVLAALDLYRVDRWFVRGSVLQQRASDPVLFEADESIAWLQARQAEGEVFRAWDIGAYGSSNALAVHGITQLTGHHGNEIGRYRELVGGDSAGNVPLSELRLLDILNVRYIVSPQRLEGLPYEEVYAGSRSFIYRNPSALPRAFLVGATEVVPDGQAVERMLGPGFEARSVALLPEPLPSGVTIEADPVGVVEWLNRADASAGLRVVTDRPALLVISENYYPAWTVEVDGEDAALLRANYAFRAVPIAAGEHTVRFEYSTAGLGLPASVSAVSLLVLLALVLVPWLRRARSASGGGDGPAAPAAAAAA